MANCPLCYDFLKSPFIKNSIRNFLIIVKQIPSTNLDKTLFAEILFPLAGRQLQLPELLIQ